MTAHETSTNKNQTEPSRMYAITRKLLLASVGAIGIAQDEVEDLVKKLVDRGEIAEKDGRKLIADLNERTRRAILRR